MVIQTQGVGNAEEGTNSGWAVKHTLNVEICTRGVFKGRAAQDTINCDGCNLDLELEGTLFILGHQQGTCVSGVWLEAAQGPGQM